MYDIIMMESMEESGSSASFSRQSPSRSETDIEGEQLGSVYQSGAKILGLLQKPVGQRLPVSSSMLALYLGFREWVEALATRQSMGRTHWFPNAGKLCLTLLLSASPSFLVLSHSFASFPLFPSAKDRDPRNSGNYASQWPAEGDG